MSKKLFRETFNEVKAGVKSTGFSKKDFNILMEAYINDTEFVADADHTMKKVDGEKVLVRNSIKPVKAFRGMLIEMLSELGMDKAEAESMAMNYKFKKVDAMYDFMNNFIYEYMKTGRKYKLTEKEMMVSSIYIKEKEAQTQKTFKKDPDTGKETTKVTEKEAYWSLGQKSSCPDWKKGIKDDAGNVAKAFASILDMGDL